MPKADRTRIKINQLDRIKIIEAGFRRWGFPKDMWTDAICMVQDILTAFEQEKDSESVSCSCVCSDAWRCANERNLKMLTCFCACHNYTDRSGGNF